MRIWPVLALAAIALGGCATQSSRSPYPGSDTLRAVAESFTLRGKMGVRTPGVGHSAALIWHQRGESFDIELKGPLGIGRTELIGTPAQVTITDRDGARDYADPARALMAELGWSPPLAALRYWAVGVPQPGITFERLPSAANLPQARFIQSGWTVEVGQLADYGQWTLPRKLTLTNGQTRLRLVATQWQIPATTD
ncbi:MAG: lipoprotein insertase outer membrane protein LolB [Gammaproteobacteria bacterium]